MTDTVDLPPRTQGQRPAHEWDTWTPERVERLKELWSAGWSQAEICGELGLNSRGVVSGKLARLGLSNRTGNKRGWQPRSRKRAATQFECVPAPDAPAQGSVDLEHMCANQCRFPYGEAHFLFCGEIIADGVSYCAAHHAIAYRSESTHA
ncbi:MAG TPA: GcrA family cell cycle regulator [Pseudolabrys sp.]|nr:GcrA family cell cycle regulator [Pseudolabrys sp.]